MTGPACCGQAEAEVRWFPHNDVLQRAVVFEPGFACPVTGGHGHGIHGMQIRWLLRGPRGAVQFLVFTDWVPGRKTDPATAFMFPMGADLGYHAVVPQYEGDSGPRPCEYLPGGQCYCDGSGLQAMDLMPEFIAWGEPAIWAVLEERYASLEEVAP